MNACDVSVEQTPLAQGAGGVGKVPLPASHHGIVWAPLSAAHRHQLATLIARIEAQDNPPYRTSIDEVTQMFRQDRVWRGLAGFATRGIAKGRMVAFAQVVLGRSTLVECLCQGGVDPSFRRIGLGRAIVDWQEATARKILADVESPEPQQIAMQVESGQAELEDQLQLRGFHWSRTYYELRADLVDIAPAPDLGRYMTIEEWGPQWEDPVRRASNILSEIEWGRPPLTQEQWLSSRTAFAPEWSFVLVDRRGDRPRVLGFLMASKYVQDWAALGWKEGYIDQLGVLEEARPTHAVDGLVTASMRAMARDGMERIGTGLGSTNQSGALAVYEYLGFETIGQSRLYALQVS